MDCICGENGKVSCILLDIFVGGSLIGFSCVKNKGAACFICVLIGVLLDCVGSGGTGWFNDLFSSWIGDLLDVFNEDLLDCTGGENGGEFCILICILSWCVLDGGCKEGFVCFIGVLVGELLDFVCDGVDVLNCEIFGVDFGGLDDGGFNGLNDGSFNGLNDGGFNSVNVGGFNDFDGLIGVGFGNLQ